MDFCPLCQGNVEKKDDVGEEIFPDPEKFIAKKKNIVLRILSLIIAAGIIIPGTINYILPQTGYWSLYVVGGMGCVTLIIAITVSKRQNILKNIFYQTVILSGFAILWDLITGMQGWSVNFVIPCTILGAMIATTVLTRAMRLQVEEYSVYLYSLTLLNAIPLIFLINQAAHVRIPSVICISVNITLMLIFLIFEGDKIWADLKRRMHI